MINRIFNAVPSYEVILMTTNPTTEGSPRPNLATYYQVYREVAKYRNLFLIDLELVWRKVLEEGVDVFEAFVPDGLHPSPYGCEKVITPALFVALGLNTNDQ